MSLHLILTSLVLAAALYLSLLSVTGAVMRIRNQLTGPVAAITTCLAALAWGTFYLLTHS